MKSKKREEKVKTYDPKKIERKWQNFWLEKKTFFANEKSKGKKKMVLIEFPYPSGAGLHMGHMRPFIAGDVTSKYFKLNGFNTMYPIGWDAFGLPAENYAIKNKVHPSVSTKKNISNAKKQLQSWGTGFDWGREIDTTDPEYYKWTQKIFLEFFKAGLAYEKFGEINWCPKDKTGLANEEVVDGKCERCGEIVEKKNLRQWYLKITDYAEKLLSGLDNLPEWPDPVKTQQANWIGKSEGSEIEFEIKENLKNSKTNYLLLHGFTACGEDNFYYKKELEKRGFKVQTPSLPNTEEPTETEQVDYVIKNCVIDEDTIIVGHSLGSVVGMKVIEKINKKIKGFISLGGFIDPNFKDHKRNFEKKFIWNFDFKKIKTKVNFLKIIHDQDDSAISSEQAKRLSDAFGIPLTICKSVESHFTGKEEVFVLQQLLETIKVFTTRADTLFGVTYIVLAPEHPLLQTLTIENKKEVEKYISDCKNKSDEERTNDKKEKTGVEIKGIKAINPANGEEVPVWVADYVLGNYGTGAVMAVPAHDERDFEFAKKFGLPIKSVVLEYICDSGINGLQREDHESIMCLLIDKKRDKILCLNWKLNNWKTFISGIMLPHYSNIEDCGADEILHETGYKNVKFIKFLGDKIIHDLNHTAYNKHIHANLTGMLFELVNDEREEISDREKRLHDFQWVNLIDAEKYINKGYVFLNRFLNNLDCYTKEGVLVNSGQFDGLSSEVARKKITEFVGGKIVTKYKLRDWVFSRQRYWGEPIPLVHCPKCGIVPVPEKDLPVKLPNVKNYEPTGTGESPLASIDKWVNTKCPSCRGKAKRETNTMPQWAGSSWYYLRYMDPKNKKSFADLKKQKYWSPVDLYFGGMEHTTLHLLYSRFWNLMLKDRKLVAVSEPYKKRVPHGIILGPDGEKMSKSRGNVINPDDIVAIYGADTVRLYMMFLGPHGSQVSWNDKGIVGARRFIERVFSLQNIISKKEPIEVTTSLHKTIKKVGEDIENFSFNTAVSAMMIFVNTVLEHKSITEKSLLSFVKILSPFCPHVCEEMWQNLKQKGSVFTSNWPKFDAKFFISAKIVLAVQVNGKVRDTIEIQNDASEEEIVDMAKNTVKIKPYLVDKEIKKIIVIKDKIVSIVTN